MTIFRADAVPRTPGDAATFDGTVHARHVAASEGVPVGVYTVEFEAGARTHWHRHSGPQWLFVVEGRVRIQRWDDSAVHELGVGDAVMIPPGEKHWHGAAAHARGVHIAVNVQSTTEWLEAVTG